MSEIYGKEYFMPGPRVHPTMANPTPVTEPVESAPEPIEKPSRGYWGFLDGVTMAEEIEAQNLKALRDEYFPGTQSPVSMMRELGDAVERRITDPVSGGEKGTKAQRMGLLPWDSLMKVSEHYAAGAEKYTTYGECTCCVTAEPESTAKGDARTAMTSGSKSETPSMRIDNGPTPVSGQNETLSAETPTPLPIDDGQQGEQRQRGATTSPSSSTKPSLRNLVGYAAPRAKYGTPTITTTRGISEAHSVTDATSSVGSSRSAGKTQPSQHLPGCKALVIERTGDRNWERGYAWHLTFDALQRHLAAWWQGEDLDDEGLEHLNAVCFHALALRTFTLRNIGTDDRPSNG